MNLNVLRVKVKGLIPALLAKQASRDRPLPRSCVSPISGHVTVHVTGLLTAWGCSLPPLTPRRRIPGWITLDLGLGGVGS